MLASGFEPAIGNRFEVMTYRVRTGTPVLTDITQALAAEYSNSGLSLVTEREPIIIKPFQLTIATAGNSQFQIRLDGQTNQAYTIESSTDLVNWREVLSTNSGPSASIQFLDSPPANLQHQLYRASTGR
jgi:hypothetical protein